MRTVSLLALALVVAAAAELAGAARVRVQSESALQQWLQSGRRRGSKRPRPSDEPATGSTSTNGGVAAIMGMAAPAAAPAASISQLPARSDMPRFAASEQRASADASAAKTGNKNDMERDGHEMNKGLAKGGMGGPCDLPDAHFTNPMCDPSLKECPGTPPCNLHGHCNPITGACMCWNGWQGSDCSVDLAASLEVVVDCAHMSERMIGECYNATHVGSCSPYKLTWQNLCYRTCMAVQRESCSAMNQARLCALSPECPSLCRTLMRAACDELAQQWRNNPYLHKTGVNEDRALFKPPWHATDSKTGGGQDSKAGSGQDSKAGSEQDSKAGSSKSGEEGEGGGDDDGAAASKGGADSADASTAAAVAAAEARGPQRSKAGGSKAGPSSTGDNSAGGSDTASLDAGTADAVPCEGRAQDQCVGACVWTEAGQCASGATAAASPQDMVRFLAIRAAPPAQDLAGFLAAGPPARDDAGVEPAAPPTFRQDAIFEQFYRYERTRNSARTEKITDSTQPSMLQRLMDEQEYFAQANGAPAMLGGDSARVPGGDAAAAAVEVADDGAAPEEVDDLASAFLPPDE